MATSDQLLTALNNTQQSAQDLVDEFAGKRDEIDQKVADSQSKFDDFVSGDFNSNVNNAKTVKVFIDPIDGDDSNDGLTSANSIRSSSRLSELANRNYDFVRIALRKGTVFDFSHKITAKDSIIIEDWNAGDGAPDRPVFKQARPDHCWLVAPDIYTMNVQIHTYAASANEALPNLYDGRAIFGSKSRIRLIFSNIDIYDNQVLHIHDAGSGDDFHRRSISMYHSQINVFASASGVFNSQKKIITRFGQAISPPLDMFAVVFSLELNGQHATLRDLLGIPDTYVVTNINLDMA